MLTRATLPGSVQLQCCHSLGHPPPARQATRYQQTWLLPAHRDGTVVCCCQLFIQALNSD